MERKEKHGALPLRDAPKGVKHKGQEHEERRNRGGGEGEDAEPLAGFG